MGGGVRIDSVGVVPRVVCWFSGAGRDESGLFVCCRGF